MEKHTRIVDLTESEGEQEDALDEIVALIHTALGNRRSTSHFQPYQMQVKLEIRFDQEVEE